MQTLLRAGILITLGMLIIGIIIGCGETPSEEVTNPPPSESGVQLPRATTVEVDPPPTENPKRVIPTNPGFTLTFDEEVVEVSVNDTPASGSGLNWKWGVPFVPHGFLELRIKWTNRDGSNGYSTVGPYEVADINVDPPQITSGTVADGAVNVDPAPINAGGFRFDFDEDVIGTVRLTDEVGVDLNWTSAVVGSAATLTAIAGQELVNETTYKIEINVADRSGTRLKTTITFVTKSK